MRLELLISRRGRPMHGRRFRVAGAGLALVAGLIASALSASAATGAGPGGAAARHGPLRVSGGPASLTPDSAAPEPGPRAAQTTTVTLPTGDQVRLTAAGGTQQATPVPAGSVEGVPTAPATFVRFTWDGDQYVIPDAAVPYLHSTLDVRMFDVSYLARAHLGTTGSAGIPVRVTYNSAGRAVSVPGLDVTSRSGATASGTLAATGAGLLGRLLAAQWQAARSHHSSVAVGALPGVRSITLARPAGAPPLPAMPGRIPAQGHAPAGGLRYYTLTLDFTDLNGNPGTFVGFAQDLGSTALSTSAFGSGGSASLSVPEGTYNLVFSVLTPVGSGPGFETALVVKPQISVNSDTTVALDARTAVPYQATTSAAISTHSRVDVLNFWRTTSTGGDCSVQGYGGACGTSVVPMYLYAFSPYYLPRIDPVQLFATPTAPVSHGTVFFDASTQLYSGRNGGAKPQYVFDFPHQATIPASLTYAVQAASLTTEHSDIYQTPPPPGCTAVAVGPTVFWPLGNGIWSAEDFLANAVAGKRTDYWYSSDPGLDLWQYTAIYNSEAGCPENVGLNGPIQSIHPGQLITATWNRGPLVPSSIAPPFWGAYYSSMNDRGATVGDPRRLSVCTACRQGDIGTVNVLPYGDSGPTQYDNFVYTGENSAFLFYRNGTLAIDTAPFDSRSLPLGWELPLLSQPATYRLDWTEAGRAGAAPLGASIETDWTFRSGPADAAASLPAAETCAPDTTRPCSFLPLLFPSYDLALNNSNQATAGSPEHINFTVTGQQNAPAPHGVSATVSASFDGGQTWTSPQNAASLGSGQFSATISQPALSATNGFVSLRITATDGSGDSVTQTIINAYGLTS